MATWHQGAAIKQTQHGSAAGGRAEDSAFQETLRAGSMNADPSAAILTWSVQ